MLSGKAASLVSRCVFAASVFHKVQMQLHAALQERYCCRRALACWRVAVSPALLAEKLCDCIQESSGADLQLLQRARGGPIPQSWRRRWQPTLQAGASSCPGFPCLSDIIP